MHDMENVTLDLGQSGGCHSVRWHCRKATGVGSATVTAQAGDLTVSCQVHVNAVTGEAYLYNNKGSQWVHLAAGQPQNGLALSGTAETGPITAAAYMKGFVYAFDCEESYDEDYNTIYNSTLYRLNPTDFTGTAVGETQGKILAVAVNYADGFLYGLTEEENTSTWETEYFLLRVNPASSSCQGTEAEQSVRRPQGRHGH